MSNTDARANKQSQDELKNHVDRLSAELRKLPSASKLFIGTGDVQVRKELVKKFTLAGPNTDGKFRIEIATMDGEYETTAWDERGAVHDLFAEFTEELNKR